MDPPAETLRDDVSADCLGAKWFAAVDAELRWRHGHGLPSLTLGRRLDGHVRLLDAGRRPAQFLQVHLEQLLLHLSLDARAALRRELALGESVRPLVQLHGSCAPRECARQGLSIKCRAWRRPSPSTARAWRRSAGVITSAGSH